jgi:hypothetical protein
MGAAEWISQLESRPPEAHEWDGLPGKNWMAAVSSLVAALVLVLAAKADAVQVGDADEPLSVEIHAFLSQGFILTTHNNYIDVDSTHGSFQFTEVGINFTKTLTDKMRMGLQLFAQNLGPLSSYNAKMDWFYLDYRFTDWFGIRAGRVKVPFGLFNETADIDAARVPILLPQSVYPLSNRNYLLAVSGGELYGYLRMPSAGALDYRLYAGTILVDTVATAGSPYQIQEVNVPYVAGGRLLWETPLEGLRAAVSGQALRLDTTALFGSTSVAVRVPVALWVGSLAYAVHDLELTTEFSQWFARDYSSDPSIFPNTQPSTVSTRWYAMATYRLTPWLQPGLYYSVLYPDRNDHTFPGNVQHDGSVTLRFDINAYWLVKAEGHYMVGTAGLSPALNDNVPINSLAAHWAAFLLKTTAYF